MSEVTQPVKLVEQAILFLEQKREASSAPLTTEDRAYLNSALNVIENHGGKDTMRKEVLKAVAVLSFAGVKSAGLQENSLDLMFGPEVADAFKWPAFPQIADDAKIGTSLAIQMAFTCAKMEGTLRKLNDPKTRDAGVAETGGHQAFGSYLAGMAEDYGMLLDAYAKNPGMLKYQMHLQDAVLKALAPQEAAATTHVTATMKL